MPEVEDECIFVTKADDVMLTTQTNGDVITISRLNLNKEQAASLAWLVNYKAENLVFQVKLQRS